LSVISADRDNARDENLTLADIHHNSVGHDETPFVPLNLDIYQQQHALDLIPSLDFGVSRLAACLPFVILPESRLSHFRPG
jgi:hypothetical protein